MTTARELTNHLAALLRRERHAMADFLVALADFDRQRAWETLGHPSLFAFLRRELGLSAGAAQYRKTAAELVRRYPEVEAALRQGELCLSSVIELAKVLTADNVAEVLPRFFGLSSRDAAVVAVSIRPVEHPPVREVVTQVRAAAGALEPGLVLGSRAASVIDPEAASSRDDVYVDHGQTSVRAPETLVAPAPLLPPEPSATVGSGRVAAPAQRATVEPLDADRARLHLTVSRRLLGKLEAAKAALSHARPGATSEEVLEAALDALLAQRAKRKGLVAKPRPPRPDANPETVPAAVSREVWVRSGHRCEWPVESGGVCGATLRLELDHVTPRALGGPSTAGNLRVLCAFHNQLAARQVFGDAWMERWRSAGTHVHAKPAADRTHSPPGSSRVAD